MFLKCPNDLKYFFEPSSFGSQVVVESSGFAVFVAQGLVGGDPCSTRHLAWQGGGWGTDKIRFCPKLPFMG
jgi:hypothetical protein